MESLIQNFFLYQWQRKLVALITAIVIWIVVSHSITATKTISSVPIRVINLPTDKTIHGLLPNGFLSKRATLTLTGTKDVIEQLEPSDLEILLDVSNLPSEGIVQVTKKNLVSLNPDINLLNHITYVSHPEFVIKMSSMVTEKIPVTIHPPVGEPPKGYEFLDIWPMFLTHTVSGPQDQILALKNKGLELTFNLSDITKEQLDHLKVSTEDKYSDEVSFYVPNQWKKVSIPFLNNIQEVLNDPEAKNLRIDFLRKEPLPLNGNIPIRVFYPLKNSATINPSTFALEPNAFIQIKNNIPILTLPLFAQNVSKLFLDIVQDNIEIEIIAAPKSEREKLDWSVCFINDHQLEDTYVAFLLSNMKSTSSSAKAQEREKFFRQRFRSYLQKFALYLSPTSKFDLDSSLQDKSVVVRIPHLPQPKAEGSNAR
jgi:hypothetical protein